MALPCTTRASRACSPIANWRTEQPELVHGAAQRIGQRLNFFPPVGKIVAEDADKRFDAVLCSRFVERLVVLPTLLSQTPVAV